MHTAALVIASLLAAGGAAAAQGRQTLPGTPLMLEIGVRGYLAGGQMSSMAGDSATDRLESYVWADQTLCGMGAGDEAPRNTPSVGWHFIGTVTEQSAGQLTVRIEWQRMWDQGVRRPGGSSASRTLTIRSGERVELDRVSASGEGRCGTVEARLEASVAPRATYLMTGVRGGMAGAGGRGTMSRPRVGEEPSGAAPAGGRVSGRGGSVSGSGRGSVPDATAATGVRGGRGGAAGGGTTVDQAGRGSRMSVLSALFGLNYDAEIWLVHKGPDGREAVQQQTLRFSGTAREFSFPPIDVSGRGGPITIDITGRLQSISGRAALRVQQSGVGLRESRLANDPAFEAMRARQAQLAQQGQGRGRGSAAGVDYGDPNQPPMFAVSISRRARRASPFIDTRGATDVSIEIPKPSDVLSFELPPLQRETEDLLKGHTFSIRLRVTPVK